MSQRGGRPIDFQAWAQNQIVKRAVAALEARDEAFAERNADTPLPQLARYLSRCAISLGHSPSPSEVDGGTFIEQRFGSWAAAMAAARLPQPRSMRKLRDTARYKAEKVKQEPLFREERRQKRQRKLEQSEQRKKEQAIKKRAERAAKAEWAAKKKAEAEAKALTLAETSCQLSIGGRGLSRPVPHPQIRKRQVETANAVVFSIAGGVCRPLPHPQNQQP